VSGGHPGASWPPFWGEVKATLGPVDFSGGGPCFTVLKSRGLNLGVELSGSVVAGESLLGIQYRYHPSCQ
jgi:hypothetical protein